MKKSKGKTIIVSLILLFAFVGWTLLVKYIDVQPIGPNASLVGFATVNDWFHHFTGVNITLYLVTDWLSLIPVGIMVYFAILGLIQWIKRKCFFKVDLIIIALGVFYCVVIAAYLFFEYVVINYRPILIDGYLEASYPSSTTLLVLCVMSTGVMLFNERTANDTLKRIVCAVSAVFTVFMVGGRIISGVHWITDIIGGILLSAGLVTLYSSFVRSKK